MKRRLRSFETPIAIRRYRKVCLLVGLAILVVSFLALAESIPMSILQFHISRSDLTVHPSGKIAYVSSISNDGAWSQHLVYDLVTNSVTMEKAGHAAEPVMRIVAADAGANQRSKWRYFDGSLAGDGSEESVEFDFPVLSTPLLVDGRYVVAAAGTELILVADLRSEKREASQHPFQSVEGSSFLRSIVDMPLLLLCTLEQVPVGPTRPPNMQMALFRFDEKAAPQLVDRWLASTGPSCFVNYAFGGNSNVSYIHASTNEIQTRSMVDGRILDRMPVPTELDFGKDNWSLSSEKLFVPNRFMFYSLPTRRWVRFPSSGFTLAEESPDGSLYLWRNQDGHLILTDSTTDKKLACIKSSQALAKFVDNNRLAVSLAELGGTFAVLDAKTGERIQSTSPYWLVSPILSLLVPAYLFWCIAWLRTGAGNILVGAIEVSLATLIPIGMLSRRVLAYDLLDTSRLPFQMIEGIYIGLMSLCILWLVCHTQQSWAQRTVPFLAVLAIVCANLAIVFEHRLIQASQGAMLVVGMSIVACGAAMLLRGLGLRISSPSKTVASSLGSRHVSLRELLLVVAACGLIFTPLRLIFPGMRSFSMWYLPWSQLTVCVASAHLAFWLSMQRERVPRAISNWLTWLGCSLLLIESQYVFLVGEIPFLAGLAMWRDTVCLSMVAWITSSISAIAFRIRGYTFAVS